MYGADVAPCSLGSESDQRITSESGGIAVAARFPQSDGSRPKVSQLANTTSLAKRQRPRQHRTNERQPARHRNTRCCANARRTRRQRAPLAGHARQWLACHALHCANEGAFSAAEFPPARTDSGLDNRGKRIASETLQFHARLASRAGDAAVVWTFVRTKARTARLEGRSDKQKSGISRLPHRIRDGRECGEEETRFRMADTPTGSAMQTAARSIAMHHRLAHRFFRCLSLAKRLRIATKGGNYEYAPY